MEDVLDEVVSSEDLKKFERVYNDQLHKGEVTQKAQFEYAWCLVRSRYSADIRKGIILLEELFQTDSAEGKRDYLYYLAIGNARIKELFWSVAEARKLTGVKYIRVGSSRRAATYHEYNRALQYVRAFLQIEPSNQQVQNLETLIKKKMEKEGLLGMALAGGAVLAIGGLVGLGLALSKGKGK